MSSVMRKCIACGELKEKTANYSADQWKCNSCFRVSGPSTDLRQAGQGVQVSAKATVSKTIDGQVSSNTFDLMGGRSPQSGVISSGGRVTTGGSTITASGGGRYTAGSTVKSGAAPEENLQAWRKFFNHLDEDRSGQIGAAEAEGKMKKMLGNFTWQDVDSDGQIDFNEFVACMEKLPSSVKYSALAYAKQCLKGDGIQTAKVSSAYNAQHAIGVPAVVGSIGHTHGSFTTSTVSGGGRVVGGGGSYVTGTGGGSYTTGSTGVVSGTPEENLQAWRKFFNHLDEDRSGQIGAAEAEGKMKKMLGNFTWQDVDSDGQIDFNEFVACMEKLPGNVKFSALAYAKQCLKGDGVQTAKVASAYQAQSNVGSYVNRY